MSTAGLPPRSKPSSISQNKVKEEELRKRMRTARREKALKAISMNLYDLRGANSDEAMKVAEMLDDIGTRSASPTHLQHQSGPRIRPSGKLSQQSSIETIKGLGRLDT